MPLPGVLGAELLGEGLYSPRSCTGRHTLCISAQKLAAVEPILPGKAAAFCGHRKAWVPLGPAFFCKVTWSLSGYMVIKMSQQGQVGSAKNKWKLLFPLVER